MGINGFLQIQGIDLSIIREFDSVPVKGTTIKNTYFFILAILTICFFRQPEKRFIKKEAGCRLTYSSGIAKHPYIRIDKATHFMDYRLCLVYTFLRLAISTSIRHFLKHYYKKFVPKDKAKVIRFYLFCIAK